MYSPRQSEWFAGSDEYSQLALCLRDELGIGVRSMVPFCRGDVLDRFDGRIDTAITQHSLQIGPDCHISETRFVGYLSHGCDPNCALDMQNRHLVALRDIEAGELLRIDYSATEDTLFADFDCACEASDCRGRISGRLGNGGS